ncbi:aldose epimerase family protein [Oceanobacillus massiliensis]|uniref:aldose epimerase family protein n=1 Tax=Oceanobacillus massiliensis TaxID=1465765 RepID=UPI000289BF14|nr:aldose epimerase family protein [Oceanobacillus massiliensis]
MDVIGKILKDQWKLFQLTNDNGMIVEILNYGGIITKIAVPDKNGTVENVVLGYKNYEDYSVDSNFFGAIVGRVAGRIEGASFELDGNTYTLEANEGENHLHSGESGFHKVVWDAEAFHVDDKVGVKLQHTSPDGEGGYPGNITASVTYTLTNDNQLAIDYNAATDKTTPLTLTNHTYFNLSGNLKDTVHRHTVKMDSNHFLELDSSLIPTGRVEDVTGTTFDFREGRKLEAGINSDSQQNTIVGNGYDHYFILDGKSNIAVEEETSGRVLTIETDQPGLVMYSSTNLTKGVELAEGPSKKYLGVCFETQAPPSSLNHEDLASVILKADEVYRKKTVFTFQTLDK